MPTKNPVHFSAPKYEKHLTDGYSIPCLAENVFSARTCAVDTPWFNRSSQVQSWPRKITGQTLRFMTFEKNNYLPLLSINLTVRAPKKKYFRSSKIQLFVNRFD